MLTLGIPHADVAWVGSQGCEELQVHPDPQDNNCMRQGVHSHCSNLFLFTCTIHLIPLCLIAGKCPLVNKSDLEQEEDVC